MMGAAVRFDGAAAMRNAIKGASALLIAALFAVLIGITSAPSAYAFELNAQSGTADDNKGFSWSIDDSGALAVDSPDESAYVAYFSDGLVDDTLEIPSVVDGKTVTRVSAGWSSSPNAEIKNLVYPRTIKDMDVYKGESLPAVLGAVEEFAFSEDGDFQLESMGWAKNNAGRAPLFPSTLKKFNAGEVDGVYYDCVIPSSVTTIRAQAMDGTAIGSLYLPDSLTLIGVISNISTLTQVTNASDVWASFPNCPNIATVQMLGTPTAINASACEGWTNLTEIEIPSSIESIGSNAFKDCASLESVTMDGVELVTVGNYAFQGAAALKTLNLPDTVKDIGYGAFAGSGIEALRLPASLWEGKVYSPSSGTSQDFLTAPEAFDYGMGSNAKSAAIFTSGTAYMLVDQAHWNTTLKAVDLSAYAQAYIPHYMFSGCAALTEIAVPASVGSVGFGAFTDCVALDSVYFYNVNGVTLVETETSSGSTGAPGASGWESTYPGSFTKHVTPDGDIQKQTQFEDLDSLTIYGVGVSTNPLIAYAEAHENYEFVPFAFLGGGGSSQEALAKFGTNLPDNVLSVAEVGQGGAPVFEVKYPYDEGVSRTLVPGEDCTVSYTLNGRPVSDFTAPGTYSATVTGDGKSVWGTTTVTFDVSASDAAAARLGGADRYGTMALVSQKAFPEGSTCSTVIVARGDNFPDALAAAGLAGVTGGQVLLTETSVLTDETRAEIERLGASKAYIVGDGYSVTERTFNEIKSITGDAVRLGGDTRLETAIDIYGAGEGGWGQTAIVATGSKAADSLSASTIAYALKAPIFLADDAGDLPQAALDAIAQGGFTNVVVLGDEWSVSARTFEAVKAAAGSAERIGGADRYETSRLTAEWALDNGFTCRNVALTAGRDGKYADALVASALGGKSFSPLLLVDDGADVCVSQVLAPHAGEVEHAYVLGDEWTVSDKLYAAIANAVS